MGEGVEVVFDKKLAQNYEAWYNTPKGKFVDTLEKEIIAKLCQIKPGQKVLEIGCGTGHFSAYFEELGGEVTGLDISFEMLELAKERGGDLAINFEAGEAYALPFADKSFDLVAMITTLEFISSPQKALAEAFRVSKGRVFLGILNRHSFLAWRRKKSSKKIWQQAKFYALREIKKLLGKDKKVKWRPVLFLPLFNTKIFFKLRLVVEKFLSRLRLPGGAFIGILVK